MRLPLARTENVSKLVTRNLIPEEIPTALSPDERTRGKDKYIPPRSPCVNLPIAEGRRQGRDTRRYTLYESAPARREKKKKTRRNHRLVCITRLLTLPKFVNGYRLAGTMFFVTSK